MALACDPDLEGKLDELLSGMNENQSRAEAISGMLLNMDEVDLRGVQLETFRKLIKYIKQRAEQRRETVRIKGKMSAESNNIDELKKVMGF